MSAFIPDIRRGDGYRLKVRYPAGTDITNFSFWLTLKRRFEDPDSEAVLQIVKLAGDDDEDNLGEGYCWITVAAATTSDIPKGSYYWDLQAQAPGADPVTLLPPVEQYDDKVRVVPQVTESTL